MMDDKITERAMDYVRDLLGGNAGGHDADHSMRVYKNALRITENEIACDMQVVSLAALLHDVDDHKLFSTENQANARRFLEENQVPRQTIDRICDVIAAVSFSQNKGKVPDTPEGKIVQDADRLDAIGAIGIARTFAFGGEHGRPMAESIQHFHDKLLLLRDMMHTEKAKQLTAERHAFLEAFLKELDEELRCSSKGPIL